MAVALAWVLWVIWVPGTAGAEGADISVAVIGLPAATQQLLVLRNNLRLRELTTHLYLLLFFSC